MIEVQGWTFITMNRSCEKRVVDLSQDSLKSVINTIHNFIQNTLDRVFHSHVQDDIEEAAMLLATLGNNKYLSSSKNAEL